MEKTWNKLRKSLSSKFSFSFKSGNPGSSSNSAFDVSEVDLQPPPRNLSSSSTNRRISRSSTFTSGNSFSRSSKKLCAICLGNMRPGKGHAIFTAECSHTFHFNCIVSNVKHGNRVCPVCRSTWKDMPFQSTSSGARVTPVNLLVDELQPHPLTNQPPPWAEPSHFSDDEPLLHVENSSNLTSQLLSSDRQLVTLKAFPEFPAILATKSAPAFSVLVGVRAPTLSEDARQHARAPIDLVVVLDVSGSMKGTKLALLKRAVRFVIYNLGPADRLSIIAFSSRARRIFPLRRMSDAGHESAALAINSLVSSGGTNIVEGLKKGVQVLEERRERNPVASIILLSDGKDNYSIGFESDHRSPNDQASRWVTHFLNLLPPSIRSTNSGIAGEDSLPPIPVHTFGIGADHDATSMHAISDVSAGTFSFIQDANIMQDAFALCIGGLLSVVAQQLKLTLISLSRGVRINSIPSGKHRLEIPSNGEWGVVDIGELYADEEKDFLIQLSVPMLSATEERGELDRIFSLLSVECSYKDILSKEIVQVENLEVNIRRPESLSSGDNVVCLEVDRQRNRLFVVEGIAEAQVLAEKGNLQGAQTILESRRLTLLSSASAQAGDGLCKWLEAELKEIRERMASQQLYQESGRAYTLSGMSSHSCQRATTRGDYSNVYIRDGYETPSMVNMVTRSQTTILNAPPSMVNMVTRSQTTILNAPRSKQQLKRSGSIAQSRQ
ncbi:E3 ubiquitin-protein ligase wav3 [Thalictrum thalictroides]|uniref:E3 ubiquitin-protein ligase wav3 n=1 Tax=Thalictrum thalictroides TaxID=46969 RepID=A0A7J6V2R7_THATH|nr:E3 ubiquitin-protein ligase wav3 [Thalictrum thalictroides]